MQKTVTTYSLDELDEVGQALFKQAGDRRVWTFVGDLGAGKTTMIQSLAKQLGVADRVTSPTFSLVQEYQSARVGSVYHLDLYRVEDIEEALAFGIEEYLDSGHYCFIEWPEIIEALLPSDVFSLQLLKTEGNRRKVLSL